MSKSIFIFQLLFVLICPQISFAEQQVWRLDEAHVSQVFPAALLDHSGFIVQEPSSFSGLNPQQKIFPVFPMIKSGFLSQKVVGGVIPARFIGLKELPKGTISFSTVDISSNPDLIEAKQQLRDLGLSPVLINNDLVGLNPDVKQIVIGESYSYGLSMGLSWNKSSILDLSRKHGFSVNPLQSLEDIQESINNLIQGPQAEQALLDVLQFMPSLQYVLYKNSLSEADTKENLKAIKRKSLVLTSNPQYQLPVVVDKNDFTSELNGHLQSLEKNLKREIEWKKEVLREADNYLILDSAEENELIQKICDRLSASYQVPQEIWPRCRIMASWVPNAFAMPGGDIFITAGLLGILSDLDAVTFVLGHEIGHVVGRHTTSTMRVYNTINPPLNVLSLATSLFSLGAGFGFAGPVTLTNWWPKTMSTSMVTGQALNLFTMGILAGLMSYSRDHERQADRFGQQTALSLGAQNQALVTGWKQFADYVNKYFQPDTGVKAKIFASHPSSQERLKSLNEHFGHLNHLSRKYSENKSSEYLVLAYNRLHAKLHPEVEKFGQKALDEKQKGENRRHALILASFLSSFGQCAQHALGIED